MYITIERISENGLEKREWQFILWAEKWCGEVRVNQSYALLYTRWTRRHKFRIISRETPMPPPDVLDELTEKAIEAVKAAMGEMK